MPTPFLNLDKSTWPNSPALFSLFLISAKWMNSIESFWKGLGRTGVFLLFLFRSPLSSWICFYFIIFQIRNQTRKLVSKLKLSKHIISPKISVFSGPYSKSISRDSSARSASHKTWVYSALSSLSAPMLPRISNQTRSCLLNQVSSSWATSPVWCMESRKSGF